MYEGYDITSVYGRFRSTADVLDIINQVKFIFKEIVISEGDSVISKIQTRINTKYTNLRIGIIDDALCVILITTDNTLHMYRSVNGGYEWSDVIILDMLSPSGMEDKDSYMTTVAIADNLINVSITESLDNKLVITDLIFTLEDVTLDMVSKEVNTY